MVVHFVILIEQKNDEFYKKDGKLFELEYARPGIS
jgi:hypothetical protein